MATPVYASTFFSSVWAYSKIQIFGTSTGSTTTITKVVLTLNKNTDTIPNSLKQLTASSTITYGIGIGTSSSSTADKDTMYAAITSANFNTGTARTWGNITHGQTITLTGSYSYNNHIIPSVRLRSFISTTSPTQNNLGGAAGIFRNVSFLPRVSVYTDSAWQDAIPYVYSSGWKPTTAYEYNGSTWKST